MRAILISLAALAACSQSTTSEPPAAPAAETTAGFPVNAAEATAQDTCGAAAFQSLIGARADAIDRSTLPQGARVITPDMMVTQDFRPERLNVMVGSDGVVGSLSCY